MVVQCNSTAFIRSFLHFGGALALASLARPLVLALVRTGQCLWDLLASVCQDPNQLPRVRPVARREQRVRDPGCSRPARTTDAVDVVVGTYVRACGRDSHFFKNNLHEKFVLEVVAKKKGAASRDYRGSRS